MQVDSRLLSSQTLGGSITMLTTAARKTNNAARIATRPIKAGPPFTEPQKFTAHALAADPALMPADPFHLDHSETSPITSKIADAGKSIRGCIVRLLCPEWYLIAKSSHCSPPCGTIH
jgi:hypothetical protein